MLIVVNKSPEPISIYARDNRRDPHLISLIQMGEYPNLEKESLAVIEIPDNATSYKIIKDRCGFEYVRYVVGDKVYIQ